MRCVVWVKCRFNNFISAMTMVVVLSMVFLSGGYTNAAEAQYRAGTFVDGMPVFKARRSPPRSVSLSRRKAGRAEPRSQRKVVNRVNDRPRRSTVREAAGKARPSVQRAQISPAVVSPRKAAIETPAMASPPTAKAAVDIVTRAPVGAALADQPPKLMQEADQNEVSAGSPPPRPTRRPTPPTSIMQLVVSLKNQRLTMYLNDKAVMRSRVSTGKVGHRTPRGIFSIIQKRRYHRSNIYSGAPMPFMQRLTWSGIALHLGHVPGYPASHGCVRLPSAFAAQLFKATQMRTHVVIADDSPAPVAFAHPNLPGISDPDAQQLAILETQQTPLRSALGERLVAYFTPATLFGGQSAEAAEHSAVVRDEGLSKRQQDDGLEVQELAAILHFDQTDLVAHRHRVVATRTDAPLRILVTRRTTQDMVRDVQRQLIALEYPVGDVDGRVGREMIGAVRTFQADHGLKVTGLPDDATRRMLDEKAGPQTSSHGAVYVRQDGVQIYSGPVMLEREDMPLGTHLYSLIDLDEATGRGSWTAMTLQAKGRLPGWLKSQWLKERDELPATSSADAIGRVTFPAHVRAAIEDLLTPGSSLIVADGGSERETGLTTDFVVLTD